MNTIKVFSIFPANTKEESLSRTRSEYISRKLKQYSSETCYLAQNDIVWCLAVLGDFSNRFSDPCLKAQITLLLKDYSGDLVSLFREFGETTLKNTFENVDLGQEQWKTELSWVVDAFEGGCMSFKYPAFNDMQHLIIPTVCRLYDDWQVENKQRALRITEHVFIQEMNKSELRMGNVGQLFLTKLRPLITFHENVKLVEQSLHQSIKFIQLINAVNSADYFKSLEQFLVDVWIPSMNLCRGGNTDIIMIHLESLEILTDLLQVHTIKNLKVYGFCIKVLNNLSQY